MRHLFTHILAVFVSLVALAASAQTEDEPIVLDELFGDVSYEGFEWAENPAALSQGVFIFRIPGEEEGTTRDILAFNGPVLDFTTEIIAFFHQQYPDIDEIVLSSPGGLAIEGFELGDYFSQNGMKTSVPPGRFCLSACAYAFLGGYDYRVDGILGFHTAHIDLSAAPPDAPELTTDRAHEMGQAIGFELGNWMLMNGFSNTLFQRIANFTNKDRFLVFTHEDELMAWYVRQDDAEVDNALRYFYPYEIPVVDPENPVFIVPVDEPPVIMTGEEAEAWLEDEANASTRGRPISASKILWPNPALFFNDLDIPEE